MPRHIEPPKTIAERGGLQKYLNATAKLHNGLKYRDLLSRINPNRKHKIPKVTIAEDFGVSSRTIYSWIHVHEGEQKARAISEAQLVPESES